MKLMDEVKLESSVEALESILGVYTGSPYWPDIKQNLQALREVLDTPMKPPEVAPIQAMGEQAMTTKPALPPRPAPNCAYADHSYPAYNALAMDAYALRAADEREAAVRAEAAAYKWAYEYLQSRMESIGRKGWAHDCDGEIEARIKSAAGEVKS